MSIYKHAFGQTDDDFTEKDVTEVGELKSLMNSHDTAEVIADSIDTAFDESQNDVSFAEAERNAHNIDTVGMERLFDMRFKAENQYANESLALALGAGIAAGLLLVIGLLAKRFDWAAFFLERNAAKFEKSKENIDKKSSAKSDRYDREIESLETTHDPDRLKTLLEELEKNSNSISDSIGTELAQSILHGKVVFMDANDAINSSINSLDTINGLIYRTSDIIDSFTQVGENFGKKGDVDSAKIIEEFIKSIETFYKKEERHIASTITPEMLKVLNKVIKVDVKFKLPRDLDAKAVSGSFRELFDTIKTGRSVMSEEHPAKMSPLAISRLTTINLDGTKDSMSIYENMKKHSISVTKKVEETRDDIKDLSDTLDRLEQHKSKDSHEAIRDSSLKSSGHKLKNVIDSLNQISAVLQQILLISELIRVTSVKMYDTQQNAIVTVNAQNKLRDANIKP